MPDREPTPMELHRRMEAFDRRQNEQDTLARDRHAENRESMREIRDAVRDQTEATNGLSEKVAIQNGRVTALEFGSREMRRDMALVQQHATVAATEAAVTAIRETAPIRDQSTKEAAVAAIQETAVSRNSASALTAKWAGITGGAVAGIGIAFKVIMETLQALHWIQ